MTSASQPEPHKIAVVIAVYDGATTLEPLVAELAPLSCGFATPGGVSATVVEVILVHDCGPDNSDEVIRALSQKYPFVVPVWLSRNSGQHAATLAGMASTSAEWIATMDDDGQHDPADIGVMLDSALAARSPVVYGKPITRVPHSATRNVTSRLAKRIIGVLAPTIHAPLFNAFRLVEGEVGRAVANYAGGQVYLDVALSWVAPEPATAPITVRSAGREGSTWNYRSLFGHFWKMLLTTGTRPMRVCTWSGAVLGLGGFIYALYLAIRKIAGDDVPMGWTTTLCAILVTAGVILFGLGMVGEYVGISVNMAMGKPAYLIVSDRAAGPLGRGNDLRDGADPRAQDSVPAIDAPVEEPGQNTVP